MPLASPLEALEDRRLGLGVERGSRLVEDDEIGVAHVGARDGDLLPLAAGEVAALGEQAAERLLVLHRQAVDHRRGEALLGGGDDARLVGDRLDAADADVLAGGEAVVDEVLEDDADVRADVRRGRSRGGRCRRR